MVCEARAQEEDMSIDIEYDVVTHTFFCDDHVSDTDFIEALWEQWETDYCSPQFDPHIRHTYARYVRGNPGYWKETKYQNRGRGTKPITAIDGGIINLGPNKCPTCDSLMMMSDRTIDSNTEHESWNCGNCRTYVEITRPR